VIVAKGDAFDHGISESTAAALASTASAGGFSHVLSSCTAFGKNVMPRAAALLDVAQVSDVVAIESEDVFVRPIYAGSYM
jgi:electron transfer flavoprotein alpha subunit